MHGGDEARAAADFEGMKCDQWPPWGCAATAYVHKPNRESKMSPVAVPCVWLGFGEQEQGGDQAQTRHVVCMWI